MKKDSGILLQLGHTTPRQRGFQVYDGNLEKFPYPFKNNEVHLINAPHIIEHINYKIIWKFFDECWRILKASGQLAVSCPYAGSSAFFSDPTHCTAFSEKSFAYLDPDYAPYQIYKPKPWRIEKGNPVWHTEGNLECLLMPRK